MGLHTKQKPRTPNPSLRQPREGFYSDLTLSTIVADPEVLLNAKHLGEYCLIIEAPELSHNS
jgi:hypothetical protein